MRLCEDYHDSAKKLKEVQLRFVGNYWPLFSSHAAPVTSVSFLAQFSVVSSGEPWLSRAQYTDFFLLLGGILSR